MSPDTDISTDRVMTFVYLVRTAHVDGSHTRRYTTLAGAVKRFESMLGYSITQAIADHYHHTIEKTGVTPPVENVNYLHAVNDIGGTVEFIRRQTEE